MHIDILVYLCYYESMNTRPEQCSGCPVAIWCETTKDLNPGFIKDSQETIAEQSLGLLGPEIAARDAAIETAVEQNKLMDHIVDVTPEQATAQYDWLADIGIQTAGGYNNAILGITASIVNTEKHIKRLQSNLDLANSVSTVIAEGCERGAISSDSEKKSLLGRLFKRSSDVEGPAPVLSRPMPTIAGMQELVCHSTALSPELRAAIAESWAAGDAHVARGYRSYDDIGK